MIRSQIPNLLTLANLFCGCIAIVFAFQGKLEWSAYLVGIACVFDFLDGMIARLLNVKSEMGKQLDSLADVVSFGVVPGVIMFHLIQAAELAQRALNFDLTSLMNFGDLMTRSNTSDSFLPWIAFLIPVFSAYRLAKFNIDTRQTDSFIGVPTPANAILISSLALIMPVPNMNLLMETLPGILGGDFNIQEKVEEFSSIAWLANPTALAILTVVASLSLIAPLPLFALKFKNLSWKDNSIRFIFLALAAALLIIFRLAGIPLIIVLYILLSILNNTLKK